MSSLNIGLGALASPYDSRDHAAYIEPELSDKHITDISGLRVRMQYGIGKCTGEATAKKTDELFRIDSSDDFLYRGTKDKIDLNLKEGSCIRNVLKFAQKYGVCTRNDFEIPVTDETTYKEYLSYNIPQYAYDRAEKYHIGEYLSIPIEISLLKAAIRKYGTIIVRLEVGDEWYIPSWMASDILPLKSPKKVISGHAVILYGYDSTLVPGKTAFYVANSWSTRWAANGNGYFFFEDYKPTEAWAVTLDPIKDRGVDKSPIIQDSTWRKLLEIMRSLNVIK